MDLNVNLRFSFLVDVYDNFKKSVKPDELNVTTRILGGGFLDHGENSIRVEGSSVVSKTSITITSRIHKYQYDRRVTI